jgi:hypothetical protein
MLIIDYKIISSFREFIQTVKSATEARNFLKGVRNTPIANYSLKISRCIWMTLMIYKCKKDMDANDTIWGKSRCVILAILQNSSETEFIIADYLNYFNEWKTTDYQKFVVDIASCYYNILQIKKSLENSGTNKTMWEPYYNELIDKIRKSCSQIGCLHALDQIVTTMDEHTYNAITEIMNLAYWDKIEEDISIGNLDVVFLNMAELKIFLDEILPSSVERTRLNEFIDIDFMKSRVKNGVFDQDYLLNLFTFIMNLLAEWDALHFRERYEMEKTVILHMTESMDVSFSKLIRLVLEKSFYYTIDLKNRKEIWNKLLEQHQ